MRLYLDIIRISWPLALGMVNNAVMQFVDRAYLAHESMASLEAVLPASTLASVFICFFQGLIGYSGVFVAQHHGAGESRRALDSYRCGLLLAVAAGLCMFAFLPLGSWIFSMTAASDSIVGRELAYYDVVIVGAVFLYGQMAVASYFTGIGETRIVFWVNLAGNLINIALDPLLIFTCSMGIAGAAYATVIAQALQFAVLFTVARLKICRRVPAAAPAPVGERFAALCRQALSVLKFGVPAGGYDILNMLSFTIFVFVTGTMGEVDFAVSNACFTINYLAYAPMMGFAIGVQTLVGQSMGRGDVAGAAKYLRRTIVLVLAFSFAVSSVIITFRHPILSLFAPADAALAQQFHSIGVPLIALMCTWIFFDAVDTVLSGALKGAGDTRFVFVWMLICAFAVWMPLVFVVRALDCTMAQLWATMVVYALVIAVGTVWRWRRGRWKKIRII